MLISLAPPQLPGLAVLSESGALCPVDRMSGLSGDPFGITDVLGIVSNWIQAGKQEKIAKQQIAVQNAALKQQKVVDAENFAASQAQVLTVVSQQDKQNQELALFGIGAAAVIVAGLFIFGAVRK